MKIINHLWQIGSGGLTASEDAAIYLIRFEHQAALIDAGCGNAHDGLDRIAAAWGEAAISMSEKTLFRYAAAPQ